MSLAIAETSTSKTSPHPHCHQEVCFPQEDAQILLAKGEQDLSLTIF
jgi:hypothetical protein